MYQVSKEDRFFIVENFALRGDIVKLSMPLENRGRDVVVDSPADIGKVKRTGLVQNDKDYSPDGQSLLGVAINSINNGVRGDSNATPDEIK